MATAPRIYQFPKLFKRLSNQKQRFTNHFIDLRESKTYRLKEQTVLVPGLKMLRELRDDNFQFKSMVATVEKDPHDESAIKHPAIDLINNPDAFPATNYFVCDVDLTRRILGTASRPGRHEIFGEVILKKLAIPSECDRMLVFDHVNDPGNLGNLVRTAKALGWNSGVITTGTCDMYNDKTIRASRGLTLKWPHELVPVPQLVEYLKRHKMTPVVADMLPAGATDAWTPEGSSISFWNFQGKAQALPARPALILSSEHRGVQGLDEELRVSIPMARGVESLNVATAGGMVMQEMNRLLGTNNTKQ